MIYLGPPGVGKTHLAISLAIAAAQSGRRVYYGTLAGLIESLTEAKAAGNLSRRLRVLTHPALLVVDEIGYLPVNQDGAVPLLPAHQRPARAGVDGADVEQGLRGLGRRARRRGDGGRSHRPSGAPLPHRQHSGQQLPDAGTIRTFCRPARIGAARGVRRDRRPKRKQQRWRPPAVGCRVVAARLVAVAAPTR